MDTEWKIMVRHMDCKLVDQPLECIKKYDENKQGSIIVALKSKRFVFAFVNCWCR